MKGRRRSRPTRSVRPRGLVITEGTITECQYLERLKQELPRQSASFKVLGEGADPLRVVKRAVKEMKRAEYDWAVCCGLRSAFNL